MAINRDDKDHDDEDEEDDEQATKKEFYSTLNEKGIKILQKSFNGEGEDEELEDGEVEGVLSEEDKKPHHSGEHDTEQSTEDEFEVA